MIPFWSCKGTNRATLDLTGSGIVAPNASLPESAGQGHPERLPMEAKACREYAQEMRRRYRVANRRERGRLLDEFTAVTGFHRKYAIALLGKPVLPRKERAAKASRFTATARAALVAIWRAADYPWSVRLAAIIPLWMPWARATLALDEETCTLLTQMSPRSMDRCLHPHRVTLKRRLYGRTKPGTLLKHQVPIRSERWDTSEVGWCETDTVAHCGESSHGEFACSVNVTDVASTWTETRAILGKGQRFTVEALEEIRCSLPFPLRGLDSDSGSEFINAHCVDWCKKQQLQFTRSRPYHKNDNAHVEQKNFTHVRKIFGWKRIDSPQAIAMMNELYRNELRLFMNYFQPSVKLVERVRVGSRVRRKYDKPSTPFERLIALGVLTPERIAAMTQERASCDPFALSAAIELKVAAILAMPSQPITAGKTRPASGLVPLSGKSAQVLTERAAVPVRSYAAR
jgi:hypothetical protein